MSFYTGKCNKEMVCLILTQFSVREKGVEEFGASVEPEPSKAFRDGASTTEATECVRLIRI